MSCYEVKIGENLTCAICRQVVPLTSFYDHAKDHHPEVMEQARPKNDSLADAIPYVSGMEYHPRNDGLICGHCHNGLRNCRSEYYEPSGIKAHQRYYCEELTTPTSRDELKASRNLKYLCKKKIRINLSKLSLNDNETNNNAEILPNTKSRRTSPPTREINQPKIDTRKKSSTRSKGKKKKVSVEATPPITKTIVTNKAKDNVKGDRNEYGWCTQCISVYRKNWCETCIRYDDIVEPNPEHIQTGKKVNVLWTEEMKDCNGNNVRNWYPGELKNSGNGKGQIILFEEDEEIPFTPKTMQNMCYFVDSEGYISDQTMDL